MTSKIRLVTGNKRRQNLQGKGPFFYFFKNKKDPPPFRDQEALAPFPLCTAAFLVELIDWIELVAIIYYEYLYIPIL